MEEKKELTVEEAIHNTEMKLAEVLNESRLSPGVLELIVRNIYNQLRDATVAIYQKPEDTPTES